MLRQYQSTQLVVGVHQRQTLSLKGVKGVGRVAKVYSLDKSAIAQHACELLQEALLDAIRLHGHARLAISGGSATSPLPLLRKTLGSDWQRTKLTWVDERCVDYNDPTSNRGTLYRDGGLSENDMPSFELALWHDGETPERATARVDRVLRDEFAGALDVALLGMGADGHIASLFPGRAPTHGKSGRVAYVADSPKPPPQRMTLSLPFLRKTSHCFLIAMGEAKRDVVERVVAGDPKLPASALVNLTILTDIELEH